MSEMRFVLLSLFVFAAGCDSGPPKVKVTGTVRLNADVLVDATVTFHPTGKTPSSGAAASLTDKNGQYQLDAMAEGEYKVVISKRLRKDGSLPPPGVSPMDSDAQEMLPVEYSELEHTKLTAKVAEKGRPIDFGLRAPRK